MEILGIGPPEVIFIVLLALILVGPRDLGNAARSLGRTLNRIYRSEAWRNLTQASRTLRGLPNRLAHEAALEELDQVRQELRDAPRPPGVASPPIAAAAGPAALRPPVAQTKTRATKLPSGTVSRQKPPSATKRAIPRSRKTSTKGSSPGRRSKPRSPRAPKRPARPRAR